MPGPSPSQARLQIPEEGLDIACRKALVQTPLPGTLLLGSRRTPPAPGRAS